MILWQKTNYKSDIQFLIDTNIYEYDISKANINILRDANILTKDQYQYYYQAPRMVRQIAIGKLLGQNPEVKSILKNGITNARKVFQETNNINDSEILAIRNDAITIVGRPAYNLQITDRVAFKEAGHFTSYYKINYQEYFYMYDVVTQNENLEVKGLGDSSISLHSSFMLEFLTELFYSAQIEGPKMAISLLQMFYNNYINRLLDVGYYRELNSQSKYRFLVSDKNVSLRSIYADWLSNYDKRYIDIGFNESILRYLNSIYASIYFAQQSKSTRP